MDREELNRLSKVILDCSIEVHKFLGPGLLESVYEKCLCKEFSLRDVKYYKQVNLPIKYKGLDIDGHLVIDLLVENEIIIELKSVDCLHPVHEAQLITYLRLADKRLGFLINFNVPKLLDGFKRKVNNF